MEDNLYDRFIADAAREYIRAAGALMVQTTDSNRIAKAHAYDKLDWMINAERLKLNPYNYGVKNKK